MKQTVIITGAGSGIGRSTALVFASQGFSVIASGRRLSKLEETKELASKLEGTITPVAGDVGLEDTAAELLSAATSSGELACLVNNAGIGWNYGIEHPGSMAALKDTSFEQWREVMRINLDSVFHLCHAVLPNFVARGAGSIVNIASGGGLRGMDDAHTYAAAKSAVINLTRSLARAYGPKGVRSNVVAPGFVDTEMVASVLNSDQNPFADETLRYQVSPLGRAGTPKEIADTIYFIGIAATYCNGSVLTVDGGSLA